VVQLVMLLLVAVSVASWAAIFRKLFALKRVKALNETFEREFWSGTSLNDLYAAGAERQDRRPDGAHLRQRHARVPEAARAPHPGYRHPAGRRAPRHARQLPARTGRGGIQPVVPGLGGFGLPYVGLFGTVWGIMHAFTGLANLQQVTLATVAPGIAEALVATAIGLFAAIPAVVAYNRFARDIDRVAIQLETFIEEFSNILQRNAGRPVGVRAASPGVSPCLPSFPGAAAPHHQRDQHGAVHRRHAGAADHLHGHGAADHTGMIDLPSVGKAAKQPDQIVQIVIGKDEA
jgi:biopolymer transport protein TolQ